MRKLFVAVSCAVLTPTVGLAQADSLSRGIVSGMVYDSIARAPLSGATIQLVLAANPQGMRTAISDGHGRYVIDVVPPGRYLIAFQHNLLDSLALTLPARIVDVRAIERSKADLAVPSSATIVTAICGVSGAADSTGLLIGLFRDTQSRMAFDTGNVKALWREMVISSGQVSSSQREATASVNKDGWFALCGIPAGVDVATFAWRGADSTGVIAATVPIAGLARHDLFLGGMATVRGAVRSEKNRPVPNARVGIVDRDRTAITDSTGAFFLGEIPAGSQTLEVRALGFAPDLRSLTLAAAADTTIAVGLTSVKRVLDTIRVVAQRVYSKDSNGFLRRKRQGGGFYFDQETVQKQRPIDITRLLWQVPSVRQVMQGFNRTMVMGDGFGGFCTPLLFLNGVRMPPDMLGELDFLVRPEELDGMEVYRGTNTPAQFAAFSRCGSIVIWTRIPARRAK